MYMRTSQPDCKTYKSSRRRKRVQVIRYRHVGGHRSTDKSYPRDNRLSSPRVHIDDSVWHLDVGSSHPGGEAAPKGMAVRHLKRYASWVQNVVRQFGPYLAVRVKI
jgi:hypothetical protein